MTYYVLKFPISGKGGITQTEKGGKNETDRVAFLGSVHIHLKDEDAST